MVFNATINNNRKIPFNQVSDTGLCESLLTFERSFVHTFLERKSVLTHALD